MANFKVRAASLFINGKKAGEFEGTDYDYNTGDEAQFGDPGYLGYSDGAGTTQLSATGIHPVGGMSVPDLHQAMKSKQDLDIALSLINGHIHQVTMRCTRARTTSHHKNGTQQGEYNFGGGEPEIV